MKNIKFNLIMKNNFFYMRKITQLLLMLPLGCFAQISITGKILNQADNKPVASASVFLNNTATGGTAATDGTYIIKNVKPGSYQLVVRLVGFETFSRDVTVSEVNIKLPDILLVQKAIALNNVTVTYHRDPNREKYYQWFKDQFLGTSVRAQDCKILNPDMLDLSYDDQSKKLTASSVDFLVIENDALGYQVKYLLTNFSYVDTGEQKIAYEGPVLFQELKGNPAQERRWQRNRLEVYENSPMHFLRAALNNRLDRENFRVQLYAIYHNPDRPADSVINAKIAYYQGLKKHNSTCADSLSYWTKKSRLPTTLRKLMPNALHKTEIIRPTDKPGEYALIGDKGSLYVSYSPSHHFHVSEHTEYLYNRNNNENTLINFNQPVALFYPNGVLLNPYSVEFFGVWGRDRVAELLPIDYEPPIMPGGDDAQDPLSGIDSTLSNYLAIHPTEKAYLQFDKPYYAAGDTIYFKAYVTAGEEHKLSGISGVLRMDLINTKNKIDQSIKLQLDSGIAWGDFALPDSLPAGNYRIRAYTRWMRNDGEKDFFEKDIPVASVKPARVPESLVKQPALNAKPDVQFLPEGGNMVTGINTKIAFKATAPNGMGIDIKGVITDNDNQPVASFASAHLGIGCFTFTPVDGKTYTAKITYPNGLQDVVPLPKAEADGIALSVNNDSLPEAKVSIRANPAFFYRNKGKDYTLLISSGGLITSVDCPLDSPVIKLNILKRKLRTGIATITLFSPANEPLCERLFFVQNYDRLDLGVSSDKSVYASRKRVNITLHALNRKDEAAQGHFSVAIVNENLVPDSGGKAGNILTYLLLTSDLKGYVEQPDYYFADTSATANKNLDLLMLTQGYRRFEWKQVLDTAKHAVAYQPETSLTIAGRVDNLANKPIAGGAINLIPAKGGGLLSAITDSKGLFSFPNLFFTDTARFVLNAVNDRGKKYTKITYFNDAKNAPAILPSPLAGSLKMNDSTLSAYALNDKKELKEVSTYINRKPIMLKQVNIHAKKPDNQYRTESLAGAGNADQVMHADEIEQIQGSLITSLNGRLHGVSFVQSGKNPVYKVPVLTTSLMTVLDPTVSSPKQMLIVIDGVEVPPDNLNFLSSNDVETVEVLKYASASIYGVEGGGGVLVITTKRTRQLDQKDIASIGVLPITVMGFYKARQFYSPKYDNPDLTAKQRDLRSTIYWNPEIKTDINGNAGFDFYNADGAGTYKITIEGIDKDGNIGRQVYRYEVK
jgi:hypothetical protein